MRAFTAVAFAAFALIAGCGEAPGPTKEAVPASDAKPEPAFVEGLPRDQWLTAATALPLADEGVVRDEKRRPYSYELIGQTVPAFAAELAGGGAVTEEVFKGKWTIVDVWGIWCGDCRRDTPLVRALSERVASDPDIAFWSLHTPPSRTRAAEAYGAFGSVDAYFAAEGGSYPTIIDKDASVREALKIVWTPTYLLVGPDLTIHAFRTDLSVGGEGGIENVIAQAKAVKASVEQAG